MRFILIAIAVTLPAAARAEIEIPRSMADKGRYYLLEAKRSGAIVSTLSKRVGPSGTGWTRCEVNCDTMLMRELGYSEDGPAAISPSPTKWFELIEGSSKSDMARLVCKRY
jgi:hypothetical protein